MSERTTAEQASMTPENQTAKYRASVPREPATVGANSGAGSSQTGSPRRRPWALQSTAHQSLGPAKPRTITADATPVRPVPPTAHQDRVSAHRLASVSET